MPPYIVTVQILVASSINNRIKSYKLRHNTTVTLLGFCIFLVGVTLIFNMHNNWFLVTLAFIVLVGLQPRPFIIGV